MELAFQYIGLGIHSVFFDADGQFWLMPVLMVLTGIISGIFFGAIPGLSGPFALALALPVLTSVFGYSNEALLPVLGCLVGLMKGATVGGAVPAILFNTPGTPDAFLTTADGYPMAQKGQARKAIQTSHFASVMGDSFSDIVLFVAAPVFAVAVERVLDLPEKSALIILSLCFMAAVVGNAPLKGLLGGLLGMLLSLVGTTLSGNGVRLTLGLDGLGSGVPLTSAVLGVLVLSEVLISVEDMSRARKARESLPQTPEMGPPLTWAERLRMMPAILRSASIGTVIGALPGIGTTTAATLSYDTAKRLSKKPDEFGKGTPEGVVATEAANSAVSGANLIPVMSLGIPGNFAAVFLILAVETIGDFSFGPSVFKFTEIKEIDGYGMIMNKDLVMAFGLFTLMVMGNIFNWTFGGFVMRFLVHMARIPKDIVMPLILLVSLTAAYVQDGGYRGLGTALVFAVIGYLIRRLQVSTLPFVIGFLLAPALEQLIRGAFTASGGDALFLLKSPIAVIMLGLSGFLIVRMVLQGRQKTASQS